ncbi:MAG: rhomboid family intramembrane serine protease, partial [Myxococcales bacterium]|nr:rhomboid family intramembrane serine protease [Myxococcales bacterium]
MLPIRDINPTRTTPYLTYAFIALNILVFLGESGLAMLGVQGLGFSFGVVPARFVANPLLEAPTILSSMFFHASFGHLAGNMLFLYIFGDNIEDALGKPRFALFYLLSGIAGALAQVLIDPTSQIPMVGASGAIAGVLGAYLVLFPRAKVLILNTIPPLWFILGFTFFAPAWLVLGFWFLVQNVMPALGELAGFGGSQVA